MRTILFLLVLLSSLTTSLAGEFADGTVVVWENGNYLEAVRRQTNSNKTHVGVILYDGNQPYVYEASKPDVHRYTLKQYRNILDAHYKQHPRLRVHFLQPKTPYSANQLAAMKRYANAQLGRVFGVRSYMTGKPTKTIHCCEYVGNILAQTGRFKTIGPRETPRTIYEKALKL